MIVKKKIINLCFSFIFIVFSVFGDDSIELRSRLNFINSICVNFVQKVTDSSGVVVQENNGELLIKKPNFFNYHVLFPEESYLISNGKVLWFYDPTLNQVVIRWLKDVFDGTFFKLLLTKDAGELDWCDYHVDKDGDTFFLIPKDNQNTVLKKIKITINNQGIINNFGIFDQSNQYVDYQLFRHNNICSFSMDKFDFTFPHDVTVDDQR